MILQPQSYAFRKPMKTSKRTYVAIPLCINVLVGFLTNLQNSAIFARKNIFLTNFEFWRGLSTTKKSPFHRSYSAENHFLLSIRKFFIINPFVGANKKKRCFSGYFTKKIAILQFGNHNNRMKNILVIGSTGQIGSELTRELRHRYGGDHVVAGYIPGAEPKGELLNSGPSAIVDVTNAQQIADVVKTYHIDTIYNLAALLSVVAERKPLLAWHIGIDGLLNILEVAREYSCAVFTPSSIGSFGPNTPKIQTPQDTIQRPATIYGVTKVTTELLSDYYFHKYGVDTRSVRFPGLISYLTPPGGGTTDYAVNIFYSAVRGERFVCPIAEGTRMDMMYMPDALHAAISLMEANPDRLIHRNGFNVASMSFAPEQIYAAIKQQLPQFEMIYEVDPLIQTIADSWPDCLDDSCARAEWDWQPQYDINSMTTDMLQQLKKRIN